jgi:NADH-quinone oxidoreductase subunit J
VSAILVVNSRNPVHSVLFLILVFCNAAGLLFLLKVDFLALVFVVVYVGAIAVLFLFVCMMLNVKSEEIRFTVLSYLPISCFLGFFLVFQLLNFVEVLPIVSSTILYKNWAEIYLSVGNIMVLSSVLYTFYFLPFIISALILLVAMLGSILLTLYHRSDVKRQNIFQQVKRDSFFLLRRIK